ncbi:hypothetical protein [Bacillus sp. NPDC077027]|uniref:hypothetical protein n=1 Tax=Bacillus sp. NPDC077027 TaxID=3390548 RepID=UPI003D03320A
MRKLLQQHHLTTDDIARFEINEAFAVKVALFVRELGISYDRVNVRGGRFVWPSV